MCLCVLVLRLSSSAFDSVRLWTIVGLCVLRLLLTHQHLQAYLNLAPKWVEQLKKEAGRIAAIDIQRKAGIVSCCRFSKRFTNTDYVVYLMSSKDKLLWLW